MQSRAGQVVMTGAPPSRGTEVNVYDFQGPPLLGGTVDSLPWVGPVESAAIKVGALSRGMLNAMAFPAGVCCPAAETTMTVAE